MKQICSWCKKVLDDVNDQSYMEEVITHGICSECIINMNDAPGEPLMEFLDKLDVPVILVATDAIVITANSEARAMLNKSLCDVEGFYSGEVFECANAHLPGGCGRTIHCSGCTIRGTVMDTFMTGRNYTRTPAFLNHKNEGNIELYISTEKVGDVVLLRVDNAKKN